MSINAASVSLAWDPPVAYTDGTPLTALSGYRVYHGLASRAYGEHLDVANSTTATFSNLQSGCSNYFAVTAIDSSGSESDYCDELAVYVSPAILLSTNALSVRESASAALQVRLEAQPASVTTVSVSRVAGGDCYLGVVSGATLVFSPSNWASNQTVTITALYDPMKTNRTAVFRLSGAGLSSATILVSATGTECSATMIATTDANDADGNGIPDAWEIVRFGGLGIPGSAADVDSDHDGISNFQEYIAGTDPNDPASQPQIHTRTIAGGVEVSFLALGAAGSGYAARSRFCTLERCADLVRGAWQPIASATDILATNQTFVYSESSSTMSNAFYRVTIRLQ